MEFDWHFALGLIGGLLALGAIIPYIKDILHGTTRPNVVSYSLWAILLSISLLAQLSAGASWSAALIIGDLIGTTIIVALCVAGYGYRKHGWGEKVCLALAILAIVSWQLTQEPVIAIMFAVLADAMAAMPTLMKTFRDPWSELPTMWLIIALGALCAAFSTTIVDPANLIFPIYLLLMDGLIGVVALVGRNIVPEPVQEV